GFHERAVGLALGGMGVAELQVAHRGGGYARGGLGEGDIGEVEGGGGVGESQKSRDQTGQKPCFVGESHNSISLMGTKLGGADCADPKSATQFLCVFYRLGEGFIYRRIEGL